MREKGETDRPLRRKIIRLSAALVLGAVALVVWGRAVSIDEPFTVAYRGSVRADLRVLESEQAIFLEANQRFAGSLDDLPGFQPSFGVRIELWEGDPGAYVAIGWHDLWPEGVCIMSDSAGTAASQAGITCYGEFR